MKAAITAITLFAMVFLGCQSNAIKMDDVKSIKIIDNQHKQLDTVTITDMEQIRELVSVLESGKREPVKFLADYRLELSFTDSTVTLLVKDNLLNNQGITYRLKEDLGKKLAIQTKAPN